MMIDDDTLKQLLRINDELFKVCKWLNERRDLETSSRLIPLVDDLTIVYWKQARTSCSKNLPWVHRASMRARHIWTRF